MKRYLFAGLFLIWQSPILAYWGLYFWSSYKNLVGSYELLLEGTILSYRWVGLVLVFIFFIKHFEKKEKTLNENVS